MIVEVLLRGTPPRATIVFSIQFFGTTVVYSDLHTVSSTSISSSPVVVTARGGDAARRWNRLCPTPCYVENATLRERER